MNLNEFVKFKGNGYFYNVYGTDAYIISYIMGYKLTIHYGEVATGFPYDLLNEVLTFLDKNKISYIIDGKVKNYGELNQYKRFVKKDLPINSDPQDRVIKKVYSGSFSIKFLEDEKVENYEIGNNISSDAEIVKIVFDNKVNSICILKSGEKFQIISKDIK